ncbi:12849_t:CDS:2, partial [Gigaspora margarita]
MAFQNFASQIDDNNNKLLSHSTDFSRAQSTTLLVVNPSIEALKFEYANIDLIKENFNNKGLLEEDFSNDNLDDNKEPFKPQAVTSKLR